MFTFPKCGASVVVMSNGFKCQKCGPTNILDFNSPTKPPNIGFLKTLVSLKSEELGEGEHGGSDAE